MIGFLNAYREGERVTRNKLREIAEQYQNWVLEAVRKGYFRTEVFEGKRGSGRGEVPRFGRRFYNEAPAFEPEKSVRLWRRERQELTDQH
jgi:hypothetical protein